MAYDYSNFTLKVDPADLQRTSGDLSRKIRTLKSMYEEMMNLVKNTSHYWLGEASEKYRKDFIEDRPDFEEAFARIGEHVKDLNSIAAIYTGVESQNEDIASQLSSDVIV